MKTHRIFSPTLVSTALLTLAAGGLFAQLPEPTVEPKVVAAGTTAGAPPADAIVLFDGKDLSQWQTADGKPAGWEVKDGVVTVKAGAGDMFTKESFGDCQLHIEWATPKEVVGEGQGRGNSGIFLQGHYELQVLDSWQNKTYFHGQAGSIYKQYVPLVNVSRPPGEWQTYDIVYHAPQMDADGKVTKPARFTVLQNGVLVQDNVEVLGTTFSKANPAYEKHNAKEPLRLQDHRNPVQYRNIWIRPL